MHKKYTPKKERKNERQKNTCICRSFYLSIISNLQKRNEITQKHFMLNVAKTRPYSSHCQKVIIPQKHFMLNVAKTRPYSSHCQKVIRSRVEPSF
ncbi:hypothetical protein SFRURICE_012184 [Spodoptera frugiperda]|nr:hypothetical protein SFRURICE_012184 [Spodoptera frugiperda]